ncbi:MAG TPA: M48 family metallopeptidase [Dermatophilaceae bacterium]|nr:M48 family metallopeptidase [Dermatophilaceae bacterium]
MTGEDVEVRRSRRRHRTVSAHQEGGRIVVSIPARFSLAEERLWVSRMVKRVEKAERRRRPSDTELLERAARLSARYLGGQARPSSIRWVSTMQSRWGSCTPGDGSIRLSERLQGMPEHVVDYVVLHELAHLLLAGHGPDFWALLGSYPHLERARGFLDGVAWTRHLPPEPDGPTPDPHDRGRSPSLEPTLFR